MTSPLIFASQTFDELKKVVWPTKLDVFRLTAVVVLISLFVGLYIGGLDLAFAKLVELVVKAKR